MDIDDSALDAVLNAKPSQASNYIVPGQYEWEVQNLIWEKAKPFIAELKCVTSSPTGEVDRKTSQPFIPVAPGGVSAYIVKVIGGDRDPGPGNILSFLMSLTGKKKEELSKAYVKLLCSDLQPYRFARIKDLAFNRPQKNDPSKDFTYHRWETCAQSEANKKHQEAIKPELTKRVQAAKEAQAKAAAEVAAKAAAQAASGGDFSL